MKFKVLVLPLVAAAFLPAVLSAGDTAPLSNPDKEPFVFSQSDQTTNIDAGGRNVIITGNNNTLTICGTCRELTITGNKNRVSVTNPLIITQNGTENNVSWTKDPDSKSPQVKDSQANITHPGG